MNPKNYIVCLFLFIIFSSHGQTRYYVKANATFDGNALSWETASNDLAQVLKMAIPEDEIWVSEGIYRPTYTANSLLCFSIPTGVKVYGGFPNFGNPPKKDRNPYLYKTILSGDINNDDKNLDNNFIAEKTTDIIGENSKHLLSFKNANSQTLLSGFIVTAGEANGENFPDNVGGAILNESAYTNKISNPSIEDCVFWGNFAASYGGAVYNYGVYGNANALFQNCNFIGNAAYQGGAVANDAYKGKSSPIFQNCIFTENIAADGGAIYNYGELGISSPTFENCDFIRNKAQTGVGAAMYNYAEKGESFPTFSDCFFLENEAKKGSEVFDYQNEDFETQQNRDNVAIVSIYPNPSANNITIFNPYAEKIEIEIKDILGNEVFKQHIEQGETHISPLRNELKGIYIISVRNENKVLYYSQKVVKQ